MPDMIVTAIRVVIEHDDDPDLSWLEQECFNAAQEGSTLPNEGLNYGRDRIAAYNRSEWHCIGVVVEVDYECLSCRETHMSTSAGLWGIESDSDRAYLASVAEDELFELGHHDAGNRGLFSDEPIRVEWDDRT